jgi:hypothetical protein
VSDQRQTINWQPQPAAVERLRGLRDDPGRAVLLVAAALLLAGSLLPWAEGIDPGGHPIAYTAQEGLAEGFILIVVVLILAVLAGSRVLVETTSRTTQLLPLALAVVALAMWLGAERTSLEYIADWTNGGGSGHQTNMRLVTALGIVLIVAGTLWLEFSRPADVRGATRGLRVEWHISRVGALEASVAAVLAVIGAVVAGVATIFALGPNGSFFAVFTSMFGMAVGISVGLGLVRWFRGGEDRPKEERPSAAAKVSLSRVERRRTESPPKP